MFIKNNKINFLINIVIFVFIFYGFYFIVANANSGDAIAIRVIKNEKYYSAMDWYNNQGFSGSPQSLEIDGYEAIRDGRTVYVNAGNVSNNELFTNIYLISYNQDADDATIDIFGRILKHWRFNINLTNSGFCKISQKKCYVDYECPINDFCESEKAKVIRDVKRLADISSMKILIDNYKDKYGRYPDLNAGSYLQNVSISTWPSWIDNLSSELGLKLPIDPINKLGNCTGTGYDKKTCWNDVNKKYSESYEKAVLTDVNKQTATLEFPSNSVAYAYKTNEAGSYFEVCAEFESSYDNLINSDEKCSNNGIGNLLPKIINYTLNGIPKQEFIGFIEAKDFDGEIVGWKLELEEPTADKWIDDYSWEWETNFDKFQIIDTGISTQKKIYAKKTGNANMEDLYKIKITITDNRGSSVSEILDVHSGLRDMKLPPVNKDIIIGNSDSLSFSGIDSSDNAIKEVEIVGDVNWHRLDTSNNISNSDISDYGFSYTNNNMTILNGPTSQKTGTYTFNIKATDDTSGDEIESYATLRIIDNPPVIGHIVLNHVDNNSNNCSDNEGDCRIDNPESYNSTEINNLYIKVNASDSDPNHILSYEILSQKKDGIDIDPVKLIIDSNGKMTGLENLNRENENSAVYTIKVRVEDGYCDDGIVTPIPALDSECSDEVEFKFTVNGYCNLANPIKSGNNIKIYAGDYFDEVTIADFENGNGKISLPPELNGISCSEIDGTVDITKKPDVGNNRDIVFVMDASYSMDKDTAENDIENCDGDTCFNKAREALEKSLTQVYDIITSNEEKAEVRVGLVVFSGNVMSYLDLIKIPTNYISFKNDIIDVFNSKYDITSPNTNQLDALNTAENILFKEPVNSNDKMIVIMSDGAPDKPYTVYGKCFWGICNGDGIGGTTSKIDSIFRMAIVNYPSECVDSVGCSCSGTAPADKPNCCRSVSYPQCNFIDEIKEQATFLKNNGVSIYSIYFKTGVNSNYVAKELMEEIASGETEDEKKEFFYEGGDIEIMFDSIINNIFVYPNDVIIDGVPEYNDGTPDQDNEYKYTKKDISTLNCPINGEVEVNVFNGGGSLYFDNFNIRYCESLLY